MKKITLLLFLFYLSGIYAQCIQTNMYPYTDVVSNNLGIPQLIADCTNTYSYAQVTNIDDNVDYVFTSQNMQLVHKYITITDFSDVVIAHGLSPLTVSNISSSQIRIHLSEDLNCGAAGGCATLQMQALLACPPPLNLQAGDITTSDVHLTWTAGGTETAWEVLVLFNDEPAPTMSTSGTAVSNVPEYLYTGLEAQEHYKFYVRANCGTEFSPWNGPLNFDSGCTAVNAFFEDFNTALSNIIPDCWSKIIRGPEVSANAKIATVLGVGNAGTNCILMNNDTSSPLTSDLILLSPYLGNLSAGTHRLKLMTKAYAAVSIQIGTLDSNADDAVFTVIDEVAVGLNFTESTIDFTDYVGTDSYIGIRLKPTTTYSYVFMDDIRWEPAPLCADVTNITIPMSTANSVTLEWAYNNTVPQWEVVYGSATETDPNSLTPISPASTTSSATVTGLLENTTYKAWVRSSCGESNGNGAWIGPISITTACTGIADFNEGFEAVTTPALPNCWTAIRRGNSLSNYAEVKTTSSGAYTGTKAAVLNNNETGNASDIILVSPHLSNLSTGTHRIKFYAHGESATSIEVGTLDSNTPNSIFTPVDELSITATYAEYVVDFTSYAGTDTNIGFRISSDQYTTLYMDDIRWELAPLCADVTAIVVPTVTVNSATVNWEAGGMETQWDVVYGEATVTDPTSLIPISPSMTTATTQLTELTDNTSYKVWVRSVCGEPYGNGEWIGPVLFTTACLPVETINENFDTVTTPALPSCWTSIVRGEDIAVGTKVESVNYNSNSTPNAITLNNAGSTGSYDVMLVSPNLSTLPAGTHRLKFKAKGFSASAALELGTLNGNTQTAVFTSFVNVPITSDYVNYVVDFTTYDGENTYIGMRHNTPSTYSNIFIDNVIWELAPLCPDATGLVVLEKTTSTADVAWTDSEVAGWQIVYGAPSVTDPNTLTPSEVITSPDTQINGLSALTTYKAWVRTVCGEPNGNGAWIGPVTFTTACLPATTFDESFETVVTPALPSCWSSIVRGESTSGYINTIPYSAFEGTKAVLISNGYSSGDYDVIMVSPLLSNLGAGTHQLKLNVMAYSASNIEIGTLDSSSINAVFTPLSTGTIPTTTSYTEHIIDFSGYTGTDQYIGIRHSSATSFASILLDKISWEPSLATNEFEGTGFRYYPNPVKDVLHLSHDTTISEVTVFNMLGQIVLQSAVDNKQVALNVSALATGTYLVKVTSGTTVKTIKVMKR